MTPSEFEASLLEVADIQAKAGWSSCSIELYAAQMRESVGGDPESLKTVLIIGAGLACDNSRFGVHDSRRKH
jgi:hypothetical protein